MRQTPGIARTIAGTLLALGVGAAAGPLHAASIDAAGTEVGAGQFATAYSASEEQTVTYTGAPGPASSGLLGDMNHDSVVDVGDVSVFVLALTDPTSYEALYGIGPALVGDINQDGAFDAGDVAGFVHLLINGGGGVWHANRDAGDGSGESVHSVPLPVSVWAGLGLLGLVGAARVFRRRALGVSIA